MKQKNNERLKGIVFKNIQKNPGLYSIKSLIDLSLLSKKTIALSISKNQYIEILGAFGFFLSNPKVLLIGNQNIKEKTPPGFYSVYRRLMDKLSLSLYQKLKDVSVLIYVESQKEVLYKKTTQSIKIDQKTSFEQLILKLKQAEYERVDQVASVKQFCVKGGIIDFYSPIQKNPIRAYFYDDYPKLVFYKLSTGLPLDKPLGCVFLNKQEKSTKKLLVKDLLKQKNYVLIGSNKNHIKGVSSNTKEVSVHLLNKSKTKIHYMEDLYFSAYKIKDRFYAPLQYKDTTLEPQVENSFIPSFEKGNLVCHEDFGVGSFLGFVEQEEGEDFVKIQYLDGTINLSVKKLFKLSLVSRETKPSQVVGSLRKKGVWKRKELSIQKSVEKYVDNLVNIYSKKNSFVRPPFVFGGGLEEAFLKGFKYKDTKDQVVVWGEIKGDLEGRLPMSRLLCGDVGFGKTELAMRAVFRVVINGGKVVVLCPTSVLVNQHFSVFRERLSSFGVSVAVLLGGASPSQKLKTKNDWVSQKIDVLISTSAALYDDVFIRLASFFVVDEEHRFGVKQKEELVNKFVNKDVLFMSATPIPRTLHLSLVGVHNISTLSTPPLLRKPINTIVSYFSKNVIKQAIEFEFYRGGQVFYLHNRIDSIGSVGSFLSELCPSSKIAIIHSRLGSEKIKQLVERFINKEYNLLLCSSVIGSGIDIPNANTIFIDNAHLFGLSQLHQIRGRVGRGGEQGFAYLLVPEHKALTSAAKKRLKTIEQNTSLGSGYQLSKADLEIRGGGLVFGYKQSGSVYDVGYEYYAKIVSRYFEIKTNGLLISSVDAFNWRVDFVALFNKNYIFSNQERLRLYRELSSLYSIKSINVFKGRLEQVYGPLPPEEKNLINMREVSVLCGALNIVNLVYKKRVLVLFFNNSFVGVDLLVNFLEKYKTKFCILDFGFKVIGGATNLTLTFGSGAIVNGSFLKTFIGGFGDFYKK